MGFFSNLFHRVEHALERRVLGVEIPERSEVPHQDREGDWHVAGLWTHGERPVTVEHDSVTNSQIERADQIRVRFELPNGEIAWRTIHGPFDDWESLSDYVGEMLDDWDNYSAAR